MLPITEDELASLPERTAHILRLAHGIGSDHRMTLEDIRLQLGITRETVRRIKDAGEALILENRANR